MSIREFEIYHGAVLTKLARNKRPLTLRLIETRPDDNWAVYTLNDAIHLYVKHSTSPRKLHRGEGGLSWTFTFNEAHMKEMHELKKPLALALVCGRKSVEEGRMEICLITPEKISEVINFNRDEQKSITVRYNKGAKKLRVYLDRFEKLLINLNEIDDWEIPGS